MDDFGLQPIMIPDVVQAAAGNPFGDSCVLCHKKRRALMMEVGSGERRGEGGGVESFYFHFPVRGEISSF